MEGLTDAGSDELAHAVIGSVFRAGDTGYEVSRRVFNAMVDRRPAAVVRPRGRSDVVAVVRFARRHGLLVSVKGGGHSVAGHAVHDGALMLDMCELRSVDVDPVTEVAVVEPGATLADLDAATSRVGLATPTGVVSMTGVAGLTLGGGLGWLSGKYGLACDNLLAVEVVTADGEVLMVDDDRHPDLFWAVRGGSGNLGVVTSFVFRLHPVASVIAGGITYSPATGPEALCDYHRIAEAAPDEVSMSASIWRDSQGRARLSVGVCDVRTQASDSETIRALRAIGPVEAEELAPVAYRDLQRASDGGFPPGRQHYWKSGSLVAMPGHVAEAMFELVEQKPSAASGVGLQQFHGAASRVGSSDTAFPNRRPHHDLQILSQWPSASESEKNIAWTRALFDAMRPALDGSVYVNNLGEEGRERTRAAYGPNLSRLEEVKRQYDAENFFRLNHNVAPAAAS